MIIASFSNVKKRKAMDDKRLKKNVTPKINVDYDNPDRYLQLVNDSSHYSS